MSYVCLASDLQCAVCSYLETRDLMQVDIVFSVPDFAWDCEVRRRCGSTWPKGKRGIRRLYDAVQSCIGMQCYACPHWGVSVGPISAHSISASGIWAWHTPGGTRLLPNLSTLHVVSVCTINATCVAIGHTHGVIVQDFTAGSVNSFATLWTGVDVTDIAHVENGELWVLTSQRHAYSWNMVDNTLQPLCIAQPVLCVSGPCGLLGTASGTWPHTSSVRSPCTCIRQSAVLLAALHANGYFCTLDAATLEVRHVFDANPRMSTFSVLADMVCIDGAIWRSGTRRGTCPSDVRAVTHSGTILLITQARTATLHASFSSHQRPEAKRICS